jgi:hypothetical protein
VGVCHLMFHALQLLLVGGGFAFLLQGSLIIATLALLIGLGIGIFDNRFSQKCNARSQE